MKKRLIATILVFCMIITVFPTSAFAQDVNAVDVEFEAEQGTTENVTNTNNEVAEESLSDTTESDEDTDSETGDTVEQPDSSEDSLDKLTDESTELLEADENDEGFAGDQELQTADSAKCGNDLTWSLENGILSISGVGPMFDYEWHVSEDLNEYLDTPWFDQRDEIIEIVVNEGVTSIGANAFAACWMVTSVSISDSVTDIGEGAFDGCAAFGEVALANMDVMPIAATVENERYAVLALDVSGSMTTAAMTAQKAAAIKFCTALLGADGENYVAVVTFSSSARIVSEFSQDIDALTTAINGIRASGNTNTIAGLENADNLLSKVPESAGRSIVLCSDGLPNQGGSSTDGPFTSSDSYSYYRYANAVHNKAIELMQSYDIFTLGFFHSLYGNDLEFARKFMDAIQDAGYYEVTDPDDLEFTFGDIAGDVTTPGHSGIIFVNVPKDKYVIHVVNDEGRNLSGVTVTCNGTSARTNNNGMAEFDKTLFVSTPKITAKAAGYIDWSNEHSNWTFDSRGYATIKMYPTSVSKYKLSECIYSNISGDVSPGINLLTWTKTISLGNDLPMAGDLDFGKFYLSCKAIDDSTVTQYELWQGTKKIAVSTDGKFDLQFDKTGAPFVEGGKCFIRVIASNGEQVDTNINLQFKKNDINKTTEISFNGGGHSGENSKISFKVGDNIPFVGGSTFTLDLPVSSHVTFMLSPDGKKMQLGFNFADLREDKEHKTAQEQFDAAKKLLTDARTAANLKAGKLDNQQKKTFYSLLKGNNKKWTFFKDGEWNFLGYVEGDLNESTLKGHVMLQYSVKAAEFGFTTWVVVVPVTVQVGLDLEGNLIGEIGYDWANAQLVGSLDFDAAAKLKAFGGIGVGKAIGAGAYGSAKLEGELRIIGTPWGPRSIDLTGELGIKAYVAWLTYERPFAYNTWRLYTGNKRMISEPDGSVPLMAALYDANGYKIHDLGYLSEESDWMGTPIMFLDASAATQLSSILTDTYRNAQPVMISANGTLYAAFLRADQTSGNVYTAVTKLENGSWKEPVRVDGSAVMDGTPSLCAGPDGTIWLAYSKTDPACDKTNLLDYARKQSVVVGSIDPSTLAFTESAAYSGNGYAHLQKIALVNGNPTLVWADSTVTDNDSVLWPEASDLYAAVCTGGSWGSAQKLVSANKPVLQIAAGMQNGSLSIAYVADEDGDPETSEDQNLYSSNSSAPFATGIQGNVTYTALPGQAADFVWNDENCLKTAGCAEIPAEGITHEYAVAGNRIYYSTGNEKGANLRTVIYDNGSWSGAVDLTGGERYLENLSAVRWNDTDYVMGMNTFATITDNDVIDAKNLVWGQVMPTSNLRLDSLDYDPDGLAAGDTVPVTLTVTNAGDHVVNNIDVFINNSSYGTESCSIAPGTSAEIEVNVICPSVLTPYTFRVVETSQDDYTPDDNFKTVSIGYADLEVKAEEERIEDSSSMVVFVTNKGVASASGTITVSDSSGKEINSRAFTEVGPGDMFVASFPISTSGIYTASAVLANGEDDLYTYNNADTIAIGTNLTVVTHTIFFDANGGIASVTSMVTTSDGRLASLPVATRNGYVFDGWYTAAEDGTLVTTDTVFTNDSTVYAHWTKTETTSNTYTITLNASPAGGGNVVGSGIYDKGKSVIVRATANSGYQFVRWMENGRQVSTEAIYTFTAEANRTLTAIFERIDSGTSSSGSSGGTSRPSVKRPNFTTPTTPSTSTSPFSDVAPGAYYYEAVQWAVSMGITGGYDDGSFRPNATCTRAQIVTFLWRANGAPEPGSTVSFVDVSADAYYAKAVQWALEQGITTGTTATTFNPDGGCTRAQAMTFLWRANGSPTASGSSLSGVASGRYYTEAIAWAAANGVSTGYNDGTFGPDNTCTRGNIITFLYRDMVG